MKIDLHLLFNILLIITLVVSLYFDIQSKDTRSAVITGIILVLYILTIAVRKKA